ncbi:O-antigen ligase family protein [Arthrobacter castelli]|uniref:O-antigen ligase family protein n=1 Tax=Arthrobacter castelli TaxID=271431 RepID=UPI001B7FDF16|nr:hypothetical protein [Arthrobacter castelli]
MPFSVERASAFLPRGFWQGRAGAQRTRELHHRPPRRPNPAWPFVVFFAGFPLWWLVGLGSFGFLLMSIPLGYYLLRRRTITLPAGFGAWLLFLTVLTIGVTVLWAPLPDVLPEKGVDTLVPFLYRGAWFIAVTVVMLFIGNASERELPTQLVVRLMSWMFLITVAGSYAGYFFYWVDFPSLLQIILPKALLNNDFLNILIHPGLAQIQDILGYETIRPKAPFNYANSWGANFGMYLPFFILAFTGYKASRRHMIIFAVLALASIPPVIFSLNRGLWLGLGIMAFYMVVRMAFSGRWIPLVGIALAGIASAAIINFSLLGDLIEDRFDNPHSNEGRTNLATTTIKLTLQYSPLIGFGATRQLQGNYFSIAAGETPDCPHCSPPGLGTQGSLWYLVFCTGLLGAVLFLYFVGRRFATAIVMNGRFAQTLVACGIFFACIIPFYDVISETLMTLMIAIGLLWRHERQRITNSSPGETGVPSTKNQLPDT